MSNKESNTYRIDSSDMRDTIRDAIVRLGISMGIHAWIDGDSILYQTNALRSSELMTDLKYYDQSIRSEIIKSQVEAE